jgi:hypothetical protein
MELYGYPVPTFALCYALLAYPVIYIVYQLWLHPLSRYPGPKLACLTIWYKGYYDLVVGGGMLAHLEELHRKYGESHSDSVCTPT